MTSSDFWRDLAEQFRMVPDGWTTSAHWDCGAGEMGLGSWVIRGSTVGQYSFRALAARGAKKIAGANAADLVHVWLDRMRLGGFGFKTMQFDVIQNPDGTEQEKCVAGYFTNVCLVSANYCKKLEADAVQDEFDQEKQNLVNARIFLKQANKIQKRLRNLKVEVRPPEAAQKNDAPQESVATQLTRLKKECRWTTEELSEATEINTRSVQRHLAGHAVPYDRFLRAYEREFSKCLNRKVVIKKMS